MGVPADAIPDAEAAARWLLVAWRKDGSINYALSNLPPDTTLEQAVGLWKERRQVERGYEQLKGELGLDHFEGRSWSGFHHHAAMTFLAHGSLALERQRAQSVAEPPIPEDSPPMQARCQSCDSFVAPHGGWGLRVRLPPVAPPTPSEYPAS